MVVQILSGIHLLSALVNYILSIKFYFAILSLNVQIINFDIFPSSNLFYTLYKSLININVFVNHQIFFFFVNCKVNGHPQELFQVCKKIWVFQEGQRLQQGFNPPKSLRNLENTAFQGSKYQVDCPGHPHGKVQQ